MDTYREWTTTESGQAVLMGTAVFLFFTILGLSEDSGYYRKIIGVIWAFVGLGVLSFYSFPLYTTMVFNSRNFLTQTLLKWTIGTTYGISMIQAIGYGWRWHSGQVEDPYFFCLCTFADLSIFSIITKRADFTREHTGTVDMIVYYSCRLFQALLFSGLHIYADPGCWKLASEVVSNSWVYVLLWTSPILFEAFILSE